MLSLQKMLSRNDPCFSLLEACAGEARVAIQALSLILKTPGEDRSLDVFMQDVFIEARRKNKQIIADLSDYLSRTFVTPLDREDIETLSYSLYRITKTAEKFGERFMLTRHHAQGLDFARHIELLDQAAVLLVDMVAELRSGTDLERVNDLNIQLHQIEGDADKLMLEFLRRLYGGGHTALQAIVARDLLELLEKVFDRCRDVGNTTFHTVIRHA